MGRGANSPPAAGYRLVRPRGRGGRGRHPARTRRRGAYPMGHPWLSVIMPTYNGEMYLRSALESVLSQADDRIEILAVDDGSTDSTLRILESYRGRMPLTIFERG